MHCDGSHDEGGFLADDLPTRLGRSLPRIDPNDPLADGGDAIHALLEAGDLERAGVLLEAAMKRAVQAGEPAQVFLCHLLKAHARTIAGDSDQARRLLEKALAIPPPARAGRHPALLATVGLEVSLLLQDATEAEAFLEDLRNLASRESPVLRDRIALGEAELLLQRGERVAALARLDAIPAASAANESSWRGLKLRAETALGQGDLAAAVSRLEEAVAAAERFAALLPDANRRHYLDSPPRRDLAERVERVRRSLSAETDASRTVPRPQLLLAAFRGILDGIRELDRRGDLGALLDLVLDALIRFSGALRGMVVLLEEGTTRVERGRHLEGRALKADELRISRTIAAKAAQEGRTVALADASADLELSSRASISGQGLRSVLAVPLIAAGRTLGAIYLDDPRRTDAFPADVVETAGVLVGHAALAIEHAHLVERVTRDGLTDAWTHSFFQDQLRRTVSLAQRHRRACSLLLLDLDDFKRINDTYGHDFGNVVMKSVADALRDCLRESDGLGCGPVAAGGEAPDPTPPRLGRFGGDEFELLLPETDDAGLESLARKVVQRVGALTLAREGRPVSITVSVGGASFPHHAESAERLFQAADEALFQAKRAGRNRHALAGGASSTESEVTDSEVDTLLLTREGRIALGMVGKILEQGDDLEQLLRATLAVMAKAARAERGFILLFDDGHSPSFKLALDMHEDSITPEELPFSFTVVDRVRKSREAILIADARQDPRVSDRRSILSLGIRSCLAVPLHLPPPRTGAAYLDIRAADRRFTREDLVLLQVFARRISPVIAHARTLRERTERIAHLEEVVDRGLAELGIRNRYTNIVGRSAAMRALFQVLDPAVSSPYPVIVLGETGSGKELIAKAIHYEGPRKDKPFIAVNCGALAETVLESELFGHAKGAFTGADRNKDGLFKLADGGTLFLDEVEDMSEGMQRKILRTVEEHRVWPVGARASVPVDVRLVAASNRDLEGLVKAGKFRQDLYFRLKVFCVNVPPLRQRVEDLELLAAHLLEKIAVETRTSPKRIHPECWKALIAYPWPGNVRELENELRRMAAMADAEIRPEHIPDSVRQAVAAPAPALQDQVRDLERERIRQALQSCAGNVSKAAVLLGMKRTTLIRRIAEYRLGSQAP